MENGYLIGATLLYFTVLLMVGLLAHKKHSSEADFIVGGRSLNFWVVALSAHASDMSVWLFMAFPMSIFLQGMSQAWIAVGLLIGMFLTWQLIAPRLRINTEKYGCYTLSSFFEKRFNDTSNTIKILSAVMFLVFLTHYLSAGMIGIGLFLESLFGLNYYFGLCLVLLVVSIYTFVGGFIAVAWTDLFQAIFLLAVILLVPFIAYQSLAAPEQIFSIAEAKNISLSLIPEKTEDFILTIILAINWGLGYFGMPHIITKFMSIKSASELNKSKWLGMAWQLTVLTAAIAIGAVGIAFFPNGLANPQLIFTDMVQALFHPFLAGLFLCGVLAASLSTIDSQLLVCVSVISEDLYPFFLKRNATSVDKLKVSRIGVFVISTFALALSLNRNTTIMSTVSYAWAGLGSSFGPIVLASLYSTKANRYGIVAGILSGGLLAMSWPYLNPFILPYQIDALIPGFLLSTFSIYSVSYLTRTQKDGLRSLENQNSRLPESNVSIG